MPATKPLDLVLSGGGVKGVGLVGAVVRLMEAGYRARRVAGTSAGSIVGSIVAAAGTSKKLGPRDIRDLAMSIDYRNFLDPGVVERVPLLGPAWAILEGRGVYKGDSARDFVGEQLKRLGVETFGDLRLDVGRQVAERLHVGVELGQETLGEARRLARRRAREREQEVERMRSHHGGHGGRHAHAVAARDEHVPNVARLVRRLAAQVRSARAEQEPKHGLTTHEGIDEQLQAFMAKRKEVLPDNVS